MLIPMLVALAALGTQQKPDLDAQTLERINVHRKAAGLDPVTMDPALSKGCGLHAQYLVTNSKHPSTDGLGMHSEDAKLPGFTKEGAAAGKAAVVFPTGDPLAAVDKWMASLFHRVPLLDPELAKVGLGFAKGGKWGGYVVVDTINGRQPKQVLKETSYPADGQKDVPLAYAPEVPDPIPEHKDKPAGYPITVTFPDDKVVKDVTGTLVDGANKDVPIYLSSPEKPAGGQGQFQRNTICLFAQAPFKPNTTYTVSLKAKVDKQEWTKTWSFTTGAAAKKK
jgi:hypothetical protein